jgi:hypothetical protein
VEAWAVLAGLAKQADTVAVDGALIASGLLDQRLLARSFGAATQSEPRKKRG